LTDLFRLAQVLGFAEALKRQYQISTRFEIAGTRRTEHLRQLGLLKYFDYQDIQYSTDIPEDQAKQLDLFAVSPDVTSHTLPKSYWHCILPMTPIPHDRPRTEGETSDFVHALLPQLAADISVHLAHIGIPTASLNAELRRLVFIVLQELITNAVMHSNQNILWVALAIERTSNPDQQRPSAGRSTFAQDSYSLLVMDHGDGLLATALNTLQQPLDLQSYLSFTGTQSTHRQFRIQEESLLSTIFRGNLVIRKGRQSEGLYEVGKILAWFDGRFDLFSGRTQIGIDLAHSEEPLPIPRRWTRQSFYLPGTIARLILPSRQLKSNMMSTLLPASSDEAGPTIPPWQFRRLPHISRGFFGGLVGGNARRRAEMDAQEIIAAAKHKNVLGLQDHGHLWHIDLKLSHNLDIIYFDSLLQELCKYGHGETAHSLLPSLVFTNVPRHIIHRLKRRNCTSFLLLCRTYCVLLDEADAPHFLGIPQVDDSLLNLEELLYVVVARGAVSSSDLVSLGFTGGLVTAARAYLQDQGLGSVFRVDEHGGSLRFVGAPLPQLLRSSRLDHLRDLDRVITPPDGGPPVRLLNGATVDFIHNFAQFWSRGSTLFDCAKLLYLECEFPLTETLVCFTSNGHRLALVIQRIAETPRLIVLDPSVPSWEEVTHLKECVIILDALYPGDEHGYVGRLLKQLYAQKDSRTVELRVLADFRHIKSSFFAIGDVKRNVVSIELPDELRRPIIRPPYDAVDFVHSQTQLDTAISIHSADQGNDPALPWRHPKFTPTELSTEYWENVSSLRLFADEPTPNEHRSLVFYEDTQRLFKHPRLRTNVVDYLGRFLREVIKFKIEIVLHPSHPVGAYLAQLIKSLSNESPLVLSLPQRQYGGRIELGPHQYTAYRQAIEALRKKVGRDTPRALILDDSVISGSSIFTMVGIAEVLRLEVKGIFVLVNRLTAEVSLAVRQLGVPFEYLYRVHMPDETAADLPDRSIAEISNKVRGVSVSSLTAWAAVRLQTVLDSVRNDVRFNELIPRFRDLTASGFLPWLEAEDSNVRHVISNLILHRDLRVIDLETRVAIAYNFLAFLIAERAFWRMLTELYDEKVPRIDQEGNVILLKRVLLLVVQSRFSDEPTASRDLESVCAALVRKGLSQGVGADNADLIIVGLLCLGLRGSHKLIDLLSEVMRGVFIGIPGVIDVQGNDGSASAQLRSTRAVTSFLAWAVSIACQTLGPHEFAEGLAAAFGVSDVHRFVLTERGLYTLDILADILVNSASFRARIGILSRVLQDDASEALEALSEDKGAFGYAVVLGMARTICQAQTVLLFTRNDADESFVFTAGEVGLRRLRLLLHSETLPSDLAARMDEGLPYRCPGGAVTQLVDRYSGRPHQWALGVSVNTPNVKLRYYLMFGYAAKGMEEMPTAYYYWVRCRRIIGEYLELVYRNFVEAASSWSMVTQALRSVHPPSDRFSNDPVLASRRAVLLQALAAQDMSGIIQRAVRSVTEPPYTWVTFRSTVKTVLDTLRKHSLQAYGGEEVFCGGDRRRWPVRIRFHDPEEATAKRHFSVRMSVVEFLLIESLVNCLKYFGSRVRVDAEMSSDDRLLRVTVTNDVFVGVTPPSRAEEEHGVAACKAAAAAVRGRFISAKDTDGWRTVIEIPFYFLPIELESYVTD
jgi:adenine/guanine phosphoribosyltransferase-like PRPP-binding protein